MSHARHLAIDPDTGLLLRAVDGTPTTAALADDACVWTRDGAALVSCDGALRLPLRADRRVRVADTDYLLRDAPRRRPSDYLAELGQRGFTVLDGVLDADAVQRIKRALYDHLEDGAEATDARVRAPNGIAWSADVARAVTHPVALWVMQTYLGTDAIHYGHPPSVTVLRPAQSLVGTFPDSGWHSDYPYHPGVLERERWGDDAPLGVQFNICVDAFRADNGATQYAPGSHRLRRFPPEAWQIGGTRMGEGPHRQVEQMLAPAGAALIYDARTWHRACEELNVSGEDRVAILNAVTPAWVLPMVDKDAGTAAWRASTVPDRLSARERADIERLCNAPMAAPPAGAPRIKRRESA